MKRGERLQFSRHSSGQSYRSAMLQDPGKLNCHIRRWGSMGIMGKKWTLRREDPWFSLKSGRLESWNPCARIEYFERDQVQAWTLGR